VTTAMRSNLPEEILSEKCHAETRFQSTRICPAERSG
jgi:hypothetical protein